MWIKWIVPLLVACFLQNIVGMSFKSLLSSGIQPSVHNDGSLHSIVGGIDFIDGSSSEQDMKLETVVLPVETKELINSTSNAVPSDLSERVTELMKLDWEENDCVKALAACDYDVTAAASLLDIQEEQKELFETQVNELTGIGWLDPVARVALRQSGNVTEAVALLNDEENKLQSAFDEEIKRMTDAGWDERVARVALLDQQKIDADRRLGRNSSSSTLSAEAVRQIRPTMRKPNTTIEDAKDSSTPKQSARPSLPEPAKREDVVFEVTAANFQQVVLDSDIPVLLDVYADWCGPCKQLTPVLEGAAIKSGGMFRLCKLNTDKEHSLSQALDVQSLPTVFAVNGGRFTDRFVGGLSNTDLERFLTRAVTSYGDKVQNDTSDRQLDGYTKAMANMAGMASITFKEKARLLRLVEEALLLPSQTVTGSFKLSVGVKAAVQYISKCSADIKNPKMRTISTDDKTFAAKIASDPAALQVLEAAGFRAAFSSTDSSEDSEGAAPRIASSYDLTHNNAAILNLIVQNVDDVSLKRRFSFSAPPSVGSVATSAPQTSTTSGLQSTPRSYTKTTNSASPPVSTPPVVSASKASSAPSVPAAATTISRPSQQFNPPHSGVNIALRSLRVRSSPIRRVLSDRSLSLRAAVRQLLKDPQWEGAVEIRSPLPRRVVGTRNADMDRTISDLSGEDGALNLVEVVTAVVEKKDTKKGTKRRKDNKSIEEVTKKLIPSPGSLFSRLSSSLSSSSTLTPPTTTGVKKTNKNINTKKSTSVTVSKPNSSIKIAPLSSKKKKVNEYFGGDSTLQLAGRADEEEEEEVEDDLNFENEVNEEESDVDEEVEDEDDDDE